MKQYLGLLRQVRQEGVLQPNRTGVGCLTMPGAMLKFDMSDGFPAVTTKKLAWNQVKGELIGFMRGYSNVKDFQALGCTVWNENEAADYWRNNRNNQGDGDLGRIYGVQWRKWKGDVHNATPNFTHHDQSKGLMHRYMSFEYYDIDQLALALHEIRNNPTSRRIIVNAWNPADLTKMALPPCHMMFQFIPHITTNKLHMTMYMRSCDMFLGVPFNIASYALMLHLFAMWTGYEPGTLSMMMADVHIYENHIDQVDLQLSRATLPLPQLWIESMAGPAHLRTLDLTTLVESIEPSKLHLIDYNCHASIAGKMAV